MIYPSEHEIKEYFANLSAEVKAEVDPFLEKRQKDYRRIWQMEPLNEDGRIQVLCQVAADVFKTRTVKRLRDHSGEFEAFRAAISLEGGEAELGFWCAHRLYNLVERGRMLWLWHSQVQPRLCDRIREAENLWYTPELVPEGWEGFVDDAAGQAGRALKPERKPPAAFFEAFRNKHPLMSYDIMADRIGISRDTLFRIKEETAWVRDYRSAADLLGCRPEDLHPSSLPRRPRSKKSGRKPSTS